MEGLKKTEESRHYNDPVRAAYQEVVIMGVGINKIEKVVRTVLANFTKASVECLQRQRFQDLCTQNQENLVSSK